MMVVITGTFDYLSACTPAWHTDVVWLTVSLWDKLPGNLGF